MQIKVTDIHKLSGKIYGYCTCGRELTYGKHEICPVCKAILIWEVPEKLQGGLEDVEHDR